MEEPGLGVGFNLAVNFGVLVKSQPPDDDEANSVDQMSNSVTTNPSYPIQVFPNSVYNNGDNTVPCMGLQKVERDDPGYMDCSNNLSTTSANNTAFAVPIPHLPEPQRDVVMSSEDFVVTCNKSVDNGAQGSQQCIGTGLEDTRKEHVGENESSWLVSSSVNDERASNNEISTDNVLEKESEQNNNGELPSLVEPVIQAVSIDNEEVCDSDNSCIIDVTGRSSEEQSVDNSNVPMPVEDIQVIKEDAEIEEGEIVQKYDQHHRETSSEMFLSQMRFFGGRTWARGLGRARGRGRAKRHHGRRGKDVTNIALKLIETDQEAIDSNQSTAVEENKLSGDSETGETTKNLENSSLTASLQTPSSSRPEINMSSTMIDGENITENHRLSAPDSNENLDDSISTTPSTCMLKRGRGKAPLSSNKDSKSEKNMIESAAKRKRGRPTMQSKTIKTMAESTAKRGRGRQSKPVKDQAGTSKSASDDEDTVAAIQASLADITESKTKSVTEGSSDYNHASSEENGAGHKSVKTKMNSVKLKEIVKDIQNKWKGNSLLSESPKEMVNQTLSSKEKGEEEKEEEEEEEVEEEEEYESNDEDFQAAIKASLEELEKEKQREMERNHPTKGKKNATKKGKIVEKGLSSAATSSLPSTSYGKSTKSNKNCSLTSSKLSMSSGKSSKSNNNSYLASSEPSTSSGKSARPNKTASRTSSMPSTSSGKSARPNKTASRTSSMPSTSYGNSARSNKKIKIASPSSKVSALRSKLGRRNSSRENERSARSSGLKFKSPSVRGHESSGDLSDSDTNTSDSSTLQKLNSISMKLQNKIMTQDSTFPDVKEKSNSLDISDFDDVVGEFLNGPKNNNNDSSAFSRHEGSDFVNSSLSTMVVDTPNLSNASLHERSAYVKLKKLKPVHESTPFPQSASGGSVSNKRRSSISEDLLEPGPSTSKVARKSASRHNKHLELNGHSARTDPFFEAADPSRDVDILSCGDNTEAAGTSNLVNLLGSIQHASRKHTGKHGSATDVTPLLTPSSSRENPDNRKGDSLTKSVGGMMSYLFGDNLAEECPNGFVVNVRLEVEKKKQEEEEGETTDKSSSCCNGKSPETCPCLQKVSDNTLASVLKERVEKRRDLSVASKGALLASILNFMQDLEASYIPQTKSRSHTKNPRETEEL